MGREAESNWVAMNAEKPDEKWWGIVKEKASYTALLEVEEKAAQQHWLLQLNVSEVTSTKRMPPEGEENKQSVRTSWQLEKNNRTIKQHHWEHWTAAPASSSSLFKACQKNNKRCYKEKTNLRQSEHQWDWPEGIAVGAGFLKLCEHLGTCRHGWLWRHAFCLQRWQGNERACLWPRTAQGSGPSAHQKCMRIRLSLRFLAVFIRQSAREILEGRTVPVRPLVWKPSRSSLSPVPIFIYLCTSLLVPILQHCPSVSAYAMVRAISQVSLTTALHFKWPDLYKLPARSWEEPEMKFHPGTEIIFTVSKTGILEKDRFLQAIKARKEIVFEGQKILFFPDLGTVINIKRKQWIPTSAGVSFVLNCSPPACWEHCSCLLFGKFQESYLYLLCEGLCAGYKFPCAWLQYCANWNTGEAKPQLGCPDQSPRIQSYCTVQDTITFL